MTSDASSRQLRRTRGRAPPVPEIGDGGGDWSHVHIEDAAAATAIAIEHGQPGIYNIVDDEPAPVREWLLVLASALNAKPPRRIPRLVSGTSSTPLSANVRSRSLPDVGSVSEAQDGARRPASQHRGRGPYGRGRREPRRTERATTRKLWVARRAQACRVSSRSAVWMSSSSLWRWGERRICPARSATSIPPPRSVA
jgi:hypothetical protein